MDKKIKEIAVIIAGIDEEYQNEVMEGIIACAKEYNANISCFAAFGGVISNSRYDEGEYKIYDLINYHRLDGVILLNNTISDESEKEKLIKRVTSSGLPAAALDWNGSPHFFNVRIDNKKAMAEIVNHVIEVHGAKTINYISGPLSNPEAEDRYETFLAVMAQHSLPLDARRVFFGDFRAADGRNAVKAFCRMGLSDPDAIICANDAMALAAAEELESAGYRIPEDIIVTGFDNIYNARHHRPALTTVKRPINEAGYTACKLILEELTGNPQEREVILNASPVFTGSCGCTAEADLTADEYMRSTYSLINRWRSDVSLLNRMTTSLAETETVDEELATIGEFVREIDCEQFCICLCEDWDRAYSSDNHDTDGTYTENMIAPLIISGEHTSSVDSFPCSNMYPVPMVTGGNIDSMVSNYTVALKKRNDDAYSAGGKGGKRPDRAVNVYCRALKRLFPDTEIAIGGLEASLRRFAHYDYWDDCVLPSILVSSGAELLMYGMGERAVVRLAKLLDRGVPVGKIRDVRGTAYVCKRGEKINFEPAGGYGDDGAPSGYDYEVLASDRAAYADAFRVQYENNDHVTGRAVVEYYGDRMLVVNPPQPPLEEA